MLENRFTNRLRETIRLSGYSIRIENAYLHWCDCFVRFHELRHPATLGAPEVVSRACLRIEAFLTHLAAHEQVSASTQNQALSALLFLYREVLYKVLVFEAGKGAIASGGKEGVQIELVELVLHGNLADFIGQLVSEQHHARQHGVGVVDFRRWFLVRRDKSLPQYMQAPTGLRLSPQGFHTCRFWVQLLLVGQIHASTQIRRDKSLPHFMQTPAGLCPTSPQGFHTLRRGFNPRRMSSLKTVVFAVVSCGYRSRGKQ